MNKVPTPLFDTQVAAMVCGHGEAASYESLATKLAKAQDRQVEPLHRLEPPAAQRAPDHLCPVSDVTHLRVVYEKLRQQLDKTGRFSAGSPRRWRS